MWIRNHFYMIRQKLLLTHLCVSSSEDVPGHSSQAIWLQCSPKASPTPRYSHQLLRTCRKLT